MAQEPQRERGAQKPPAQPYQHGRAGGFFIYDDKLPASGTT